MNNDIKDFRDLEVYKLANKITLEIYDLTKDFPAKEKYSLIDQLNRAVTSIGANIAEGFGRYHTKEYIKFLYTSRGSLMEVLHFLIISKELKYIDNKKLDAFDERIRILGIKINNLIGALSRQQATRSHKESPQDTRPKGA